MTITLFGKTVNPKAAGMLGGVAVGFVVGGPVGAAIGAIVGYGEGAYVAEKTGPVTYQPFNRFLPAQITNAIVPGSAPVSVTNPGGQAVTTLQIAPVQPAATLAAMAPGQNPPASQIITLNPVSIDTTAAGRYIGIVTSGPIATGSQLNFAASEVLAMGAPDGQGGLTWNQGNV